MSRVRQAANPSHTRTATEPAQESAARLSGTLRLRGDDTPTVAPEPSAARRIRWSEDVVDNEGMGKKSSKEPGPWEKAVQNLNLPTLAPTLIVTAKSIVEGNEHAVPTIHIPEEENHPQKGPPGTKRRVTVVRVIIAMRVPSQNESPVRMHMRKCPSPPKTNPEMLEKYHTR
ncbi:hypothetical protein N7470_007365 [Penicillium chermesinum]|nr:hypothetical protein N7470_007365 [Penicillium chermesinum]